MAKTVKKASAKKIKVAIVGLDTSHATVFPQYMQDPAMKGDNHVDGFTVTRCLRFETPFQNKAGLDKRQSYLESIGVKVTEDFDTAVADCDAVLLEINDPAYHLEYFKRCAELGKPLFLDKPIAGTIEDAVQIYKIAEEKKVRFFTSSSLRFNPFLDAAQAKLPNPTAVTVWGPLGNAPAGSSLVWYGIHTFEMLERLMGTGAVEVSVQPCHRGYVCLVNYRDGRHGSVEFSYDNWLYGGCLRDTKSSETYSCQSSPKLYQNLIGTIRQFFNGKCEGVNLTESFEIMAMLSAAEKSMKAGRPMPVLTGLIK